MACTEITLSSYLITEDSFLTNFNLQFSGKEMKWPVLQTSVTSTEPPEGSGPGPEQPLCHGCPPGPEGRTSAGSTYQRTVRSPGELGWVGEAGKSLSDGRRGSYFCWRGTLLGLQNGRA